MKPITKLLLFFGALLLLFAVAPLASDTAAAFSGATLPVSLAFAPIIAGSTAPTFLQKFRDKLEATGMFDFLRKDTDRYRGESGLHADLFRTRHGAIWRGPIDNPQDPGRVETIDAPIFDMALWEIADTQNFLFRDGSVNKTPIQTNMVINGSLPGPETLIVKRISLQIQTAVIADL
ncbi:MAG: hypothetical protein L0209_02860, partial [candidate division Zixibacteria bacterium]|nr:hypothetical protein [candidate division Zixibacteria bacterium]